MPRNELVERKWELVRAFERGHTYYRDEISGRLGLNGAGVDGCALVDMHRDILGPRGARQDSFSIPIRDPYDGRRSWVSARALEALWLSATVPLPLILGEGQETSARFLCELLSET